MKTKFTFVCLLPVVLLTGCVGIVLPVPSNERPYGKVITPEQVKFIVPGETTRAEVVARLGDEFRESLRLPVLAYTWEKPALGWVWGIAVMEGGGAGGYCQRSHWRAFFVRFDASQSVAATQFVSLSSHKTLDEQLEDWALKTRTHDGFLTTGGGIFNPNTGAPYLFEAMAKSARTPQIA